MVVSPSLQLTQMAHSGDRPCIYSRADRVVVRGHLELSSQFAKTGDQSLQLCLGRLRAAIKDSVTAGFPKSSTCKRIIGYFPQGAGRAGGVA